MASIVKITEVHLYVDTSKKDNADSAAAADFLDNNGIKYIMLNYGDVSQHKSVLDALGTWYWGREKIQKKFTGFPILHWKEYHSDFEQILQANHGLAEIKNSSLVKNKSKIV